MHQHHPGCSHDHHHAPTHFTESGNIKIHDKAGFIGMRKAGQLAAATLDYITPFVKERISTDELNQLCHDFIIQNGGIPAPLNYRGFPKSVCISLNHVVCHGIPGERRLQEGDILNIDVTTIVDGWHGDTSRMFTVGRVPIKAIKLIEATYHAMMKGIDVVRPGAKFGDIGHAIQSYIEPLGFSVVRDFVGHGVGQIFHDEPNVPHYGQKNMGPEFEEGMFFTVEPMINAGHFAIRLLPDDWTAVTKDKSLSAQFEHSIGVTATGCEIFTLSPAGLTLPPYYS